MIECDSVDFPDPFGPISACTSPERTSRSTPQRISCPSTDACRSRISSTREPVVLTATSAPAPEGCARRSSAPSAHSSWQLEDHVVALDTDVVDGDGLGRGERQGLTRLEREHRTVLRTLDLALVLPHVALGQRVVLVRAPVGDHVEVVADADDRNAVSFDVEALGTSGIDVVA